LIFPKLRENTAILPNSKGGVVVEKGKTITGYGHDQKEKKFIADYFLSMTFYF
jgi:hypothetical protein